MAPGLEALMGELVLGPALDARHLAVLCEQHDISAPDAAALAESLERLTVYRELVRGNLREAMQLSIPRSIARLGPLFEEYFDRFLSERGPRTHYLRDVTPELLEFCAPLWRSDARVPPYLPDLARHESLHIEVSAVPALRRGRLAAPLTLERGVDFSEAVRLVSYRYAVHELPDAADDRRAPSERPISLLVYRSPEHEVRYLELTPLASSIVLRLLAGDELGRALQAAAAQAGAPLTESVLSGAATLLADLAERGVIRGAAEPRPG
jgi:hypothetical protein